MAETFCGSREDFSLNVGIFPQAVIVVNNSMRMAFFIIVLSSGRAILLPTTLVSEKVCLSTKNVGLNVKLER